MEKADPNENANTNTIAYPNAHKNAKTNLIANVANANADPNAKKMQIILKRRIK